MLRILYLEDDPCDVDLMRDQLQHCGLTSDLESVSTRDAYEAALANSRFDLILSDYRLPGYDGLSAMATARNLQPGVPFILTSGALGEEQAVDCMLLGASDLILKQRLERIGPSILRALDTARAHRQREAAESELRLSLHEKESLLKEIHHRVKNNLQIISSLLRLQSDQIQSPIAKSALRDMQSRVHSMALIHEHLYRSQNLATIDLAAYLQSLCSQLCRSMLAETSPVQLNLNLAPACIEINQAIPCGLLVNELVTNALKHAFPAGRSGSLSVSLQAASPTQLHLRVADDGIGLPAEFHLDPSASLGLRLVRDLTRQLGGHLAISNSPGSNFDLHFPMSRS